MKYEKYIQSSNDIDLNSEHGNNLGIKDRNNLECSQSVLKKSTIVNACI